MSETATQINYKAKLASWTRELAGMYINDLKALDDASLTKCPGGCARTPQDFTAEVAGFASMVTKLLRGEAPAQRTDEEREAFKANFATVEGCVTGIQQSCEGLAAGIESASEDRLAELVKTPWGAEMQLYELTNIAVNHILYHDGQLNYVQSLNGDGEMHWF